MPKERLLDRSLMFIGSHPYFQLTIPPSPAPTTTTTGTVPIMPTDTRQPVAAEHHRPEPPPSQVKTCSCCHSQVDSPFYPVPCSDAADDVNSICILCQLRAHTLNEPGECLSVEKREPCTDAEKEPLQRPPSPDRHVEPPISSSAVDEAVVEAVVEGSPPEVVQDAVQETRRRPGQETRSASRRDLPKLTVETRPEEGPSQPSSSPKDIYETTAITPCTSKARTSYHSSPDPLADITRLRVRSQGCHCIYPGAVFQGTQKSGRISYDVTVNIVDVDFSSSTLCGYLCIRGLTEDWPELTTYFDAEIIGSRYGFRTRDWGASEQEDMSHWSCFPPFRQVRHELQKPNWTITDRDRGAVFMRWKERFLVPDHRVQDITGASFAGFYYVCVDFNPQPNQSPVRPVAQQMPLTPEVEAEVDPCTMKPPEQTAPRRVRPESRDSEGPRPISTRRRSVSSGWSSSSGNTVATMSGYYFHQNSEPYQQLSLVHIPEQRPSSFEFR